MTTTATGSRSSTRGARRSSGNTATRTARAAATTTSTYPTVLTYWPRTGPHRPTRIRAERELLRRLGGGEPSPFLGVRLGGPLPSLTQYGSTEFEGANP